MTHALKSLKNLHFNGLLLTKVYAELKKIQRSYLSWHWKVIQNLKRSWIVSSTLTWRIWLISTQALKNLKNLSFNGLPLTKVYNVWAYKVQRNYVWWRLMQNLKENWLVLPKMTWGNWQIFTTALESIKIGTLKGSFDPK